MTPTKQGAYEFDRESLIEVRKRIGVSQSKMAELLDVPANTLSRWETGATVPDASYLARIYSVAKEHGIAPPAFFRTSRRSVGLKMSSLERSEQPTGSFAAMDLLRSYLKTNIELVGTELAPVIKIEVRNGATEGSGGPKLAFTGVGLSVACTGDTNAEMFSTKPRIVRQPGKESLDAATTPWQNDSKIKDLRRRAEDYHHISGSTFPEVTSDEAAHGEVLFPGQSIIYEIDVRSEILPYIQIRVEGSVSRRHLFHVEETFVMPETIVGPRALRAFTDFNEVDVYAPLDSVLDAVPAFDNNTRLEEVATFSEILSSGIARAKSSQKSFEPLWYEHKFSWFRAHLRAAFIYLDRVISGMTRLQEAIGSAVADRISAEVSAISSLKAEGNMLKHETRQLMRQYHISEEELQI